MSGDVFERIYRVVAAIPKGKVATYGQIGLAAGNPRWARVVGYALHCCQEARNLPCHRVVDRNGRVSEAFLVGDRNEQTERLRAEGVGFTDETHVDMRKFCVETRVLQEKG